MPQSNLLVLNFTMNDEDPLLSHQVQVVNQLAERFTFVTVITGNIGPCRLASNINVYSINWIQGQKFRNTLRLLSTYFKHGVRSKVVFSHMTSVYSFILAIPMMLHRQSHFLWYAHKKNSLHLQILRFFVKNFITSTYLSFPFKSKKVLPIGQGISSELFLYKPKKSVLGMNFLHIGRFDPSKNIEEIINFFLDIKKDVKFAKLSIIGSSSTHMALEYAMQIKRKYSNSSITFTPAIKREGVPEALSEHDIFVHAYRGSLDKTLIEATLVGLPVITVNKAYIEEFGSWSSGNSFTLKQEFLAFQNFDEKLRSEELSRRYQYAVSNHSLKIWSEKLTEILKMANKI